MCKQPQHLPAHCFVQASGLQLFAYTCGSSRNNQLSCCRNPMYATNPPYECSLNKMCRLHFFFLAFTLRLLIGVNIKNKGSDPPGGNWIIPGSTRYGSNFICSLQAFFSLQCSSTQWLCFIAPLYNILYIL